MTDPGEPALSYLSLVERNNELLERLVDALAGFEIPQELRPPHPGWMWRSPPLPSLTAADQLVVDVTATSTGIIVRLQSLSGIVVRQVVWAFDGAPWPNH